MGTNDLQSQGTSEQQSLPEQPYQTSNQLPVNPNPTQGQGQPQQDTGQAWREVQAWKDKYNGLSGFAQREKQRADEFEGKFTTQATEIEELKLDSGSKINDLTTALTEARALNEQLTRERDTLKRTNEVGQLVRTEFSGLAGLFDKGLIRGLDGLEGDDLKAYLTEFQKEVGESTSSDNRQEQSGSTPPPPGQKDQNAVTLKTLQDGLQGKQFGTPEYDIAYKAYQEGLAQMSKSKK
jgi:hypothetical protein